MNLIPAKRREVYNISVTGKGMLCYFSSGLSCKGKGQEIRSSNLSMQSKKEGLDGYYSWQQEARCAVLVHLCANGSKLTFRVHVIEMI